MNRFALLFMFNISAFLTPFIAGSLNLALPSIGSEFSMDIVSLGWIATVFLLSATVFLVPFGRLADIYGRRRIYQLGTSLFTISSLLCIFATSGTFLLIARIIQGISCAMLWSTSTAILVSIFPAEERGKVLGYNVGSVYLGSSLGPVLGGMMTQAWGWRSIFYLTTLLGLIVSFMTFRILNREWKEADGERFDLIGSLLYGLAIVAILYGSTLLPVWNGYLLMGIGVLLLLAFCLLERRLQHPVFNIDMLLKNRPFAMSNLAALFNYCAAFALPFLLSLYLQYAKGMAPRDAGLVLLASPIMMMLCAPLSGRISDKVNPGLVASVGMSITAVALFAIAIVIGTSSSLSLIIVLLMVFGTGLGFFSSPNTNAAMSAIEKKSLGVGSSILNTMRTLGQMLSMAISMLILTIIVGKIKVTPSVLPQFVGAVKLSCLIFGILCVIGALASLARGRRGV